MTNEETKAREILMSVYEARRDQDRISPTWLATEVMQKLDPLRNSHPIEYAMAHLQFRQLARSILATRLEKAEPGHVDQHPLFPNLQAHYPSAVLSASHEPEYVRLELMTDDDVAFNVDRLRKEAASKLKHADALQAWAASRRQVA